MSELPAVLYNWRTCQLVPNPTVVGLLDPIPAAELRDEVMGAASWALAEGDEQSFERAKVALDELVRRAELREDVPPNSETAA